MTMATTKNEIQAILKEYFGKRMGEKTFEEVYEVMRQETQHEHNGKTFFVKEGKDGELHLTMEPVSKKIVEDILRKRMEESTEECLKRLFSEAEENEPVSGEDSSNQSKAESEEQSVTDDEHCESEDMEVEETEPVPSESSSSQSEAKSEEQSVTDDEHCESEDMEVEETEPVPSESSSSQSEAKSVEQSMTDDEHFESEDMEVEETEPISDKNSNSQSKTQDFEHDTTNSEKIREPLKPQVGEWFLIDRDIIESQMAEFEKACKACNKARAGREFPMYILSRCRKSLQIAKENSNFYSKKMETFIFEDFHDRRSEYDFINICCKIGDGQVDDVILDLELMMRFCNGESIEELVNQSDHIKLSRIFASRELVNGKKLICFAGGETNGIRTPYEYLVSMRNGLRDDCGSEFEGFTTAAFRRVL